MSTDTRYMVLGQGQAYITEFNPPKRGGGEAKESRSFAQAQALLRPQIEAVTKGVQSLTANQRLDEVIVELRLNERYLAKSYRPDDLLDGTGLTLRGMGTWKQMIDDARAAKKGKKRVAEGEDAMAVPSVALYASGSDAAFQRLRDAIDGTLGSERVREDLTHLEEIRLPSAEDRAIDLVEAGLAESAPIEIVLFDWDTRRREAAIAKVRAIATRFNVAEDDFLVRTYTDGPTFIATIAPRGAVAEIRDLNFLRLARPLPRIALTRTALGMRVAAPAASAPSTPPAWIAVFDGGCAADLPHFAGSVIARDLTTSPAIPEYVSHGTAVVSAALYGHIIPGQPIGPPACGVLAYRVLPDPRNSLELYGTVDALEDQVRKLPPEVQVVSLSFGPTGPVDPLKPPSRFTYAIDRLAFETKKLFFTAVGNWGERNGYDGIQSPSDSVNNISVGAYELTPTTGKRRPAAYSCKGPGRSGGERKPDLLAFGGSPAAPFYVLDPVAGQMEGTTGTSFACPTAASLAAQVLARVNAPLTAQACRALLIESTQPIEGETPHAGGWGVLPSSLEDILACSPTRVSVLYTGILSPRMSWRLPFLLPEGFDPGGNLTLEWTICYAPEVQYNSTAEYTLAGIELQLRPHANKYSFSRKDPKNPKKLQHKKHDIVADAAIVQQLNAAGWKRAAEPLSDSGTARDEHALRAEGKWETVVRGSKTKQKESIFQPALTVSIVGRGPWDVPNPKLQAVYAAVLTISAPKYTGDLYDEVRASFDKLRPLALQSREESAARVRNVKP